MFYGFKCISKKCHDILGKKFWIINKFSGLIEKPVF